MGRKPSIQDKLEKRLIYEQVTENLKKYKKRHIELARQIAAEEKLEPGGECLSENCDNRAVTDDFFCFECVS